MRIKLQIFYDDAIHRHNKAKVEFKITAARECRKVFSMDVVFFFEIKNKFDKGTVPRGGVLGLELGGEVAHENLVNAVTSPKLKV